MPQVSHSSNRAASIRLARAVSHLQRAGQQLAAATHAASNRYHQEQLRRLATDLRDLYLPIAGIASALGRRGDR